MRIIDQTTQWVKRLMNPLEELDRGQQFVRYQIQLWRFCIRKLREDNAMAMSAALSFRTIFTLIPVLVLSVLVLKSAGMLAEGQQDLRNKAINGLFSMLAFEEKSPVDDSGYDDEGNDATGGDARRSVKASSVQHATQYIDDLVNSVERKLTLGRIGPVGILLLIWTALTLLTTLERSLNRIFGARQHRPLIQRLLLYWSVLTLVPVMLSAIVFSTGAAARACAGVPVLSAILVVVYWGGPVIVGWVLLALVYRLLPNTTVKWKAALIGAAVVIPLWLLARWGFALYVRDIVGRGSLYGALGLLPVFLFWLNLCWMVLLFGAEVAHTSANLTEMESVERAEKIIRTPADMLAVAVAVAQPYALGAGVVTFEQVVAQVGLPDSTVHGILQRLTTLGVVCHVDTLGASGYMPAQPAERISVLAIMEIDHLKDDDVATARRYGDDVKAAVAVVRARAGSALGDMTLGDLMAGSEGERMKDKG